MLLLRIHPGIRPGERASLALTALLVLSLLILAQLFLADDFSVQNVAEHSSSTTPALYKLTAIWGGQAGSLLFWVFIQSVYTAAVVLTNRRKNRDLMPYVNAVLSGVALFFLATLCFASNPFLKLPQAAAEGVGLNPLLQNAMMAIHPPTLYVGYVGFSVPFAFAMAALATGHLGDTWIRTTRRWTLFTWFVLGTGVLLGGWWAYLELGWLDMARAGLVTVAMLVLLALPLWAAAASEEQVREIGHRLACYCGCSGLTVSDCTCGTADQIREKIRAQLDSGLSPQEVVDAWVAERGEEILAVPTREGFNLVGWTLPFVVTALGLIILSALLLRRRRRFEETSPASEALSEAERSYLERIEREVRDLQV